MNQPLDSATDRSRLERKRRLIAGRTAVVSAVVVFVAGYLYGITKYGLLLGVALGWLPCGLTAWLTAILVAAALNHLPHRLIAAILQFGAGLRNLKLRLQHRN